MGGITAANPWQTGSRYATEIISCLFLSHFLKMAEVMRLNIIFKFQQNAPWVSISTVTYCFA